MRMRRTSPFVTGLVLAALMTAVSVSAGPAHAQRGESPFAAMIGLVVGRRHAVAVQRHQGAHSLPRQLSGRRRDDGAGAALRERQLPVRAAEQRVAQRRRPLRHLERGDAWRRRQHFRHHQPRSHPGPRDRHRVLRLARLGHLRQQAVDHDPVARQRTGAGHISLNRTPLGRPGRRRRGPRSARTLRAILQPASSALSPNGPSMP